MTSGILHPKVAGDILDAGFATRSGSLCLSRCARFFYKCFCEYDGDSRAHPRRGSRTNNHQLMVFAGTYASCLARFPTQSWALNQFGITIPGVRISDTTVAAGREELRPRLRRRGRELARDPLAAVALLPLRRGPRMGPGVVID